MPQQPPPRRPGRVALAVAFLALGASGCRPYANYPDPLGPRYAGVPQRATLDPAAAGPDTLVVVTFNVKEGRRVERAIAALRADTVTRDADILLLQELGADGTRRIAEAMGMRWVYYPSWANRRNGREFGNAVLSRWPILDDAKLILPHLAFFNRGLRIATAATIDVDGTRIRVYSMHIATRYNLATWKRRSQLMAVLADAAEHDRSIVGGDLNSNDLSHTAVGRGFSWPTRDLPPSIFFFHWDHIFHRGLEAAFLGGGTVPDNHDASDHAPVWVRLALPPKEIVR